MKPVIIHSEAIAELDGAIAYYEGQKIGLGLDFLVEVERMILDNSLSWEEVKASIKRRQ